MFLFAFTYYKGVLFVGDFFVCLAAFVLHDAAAFLHCLGYVFVRQA